MRAITMCAGVGAILLAACIPAPPPITIASGTDGFPGTANDSALPWDQTSTGARATDDTDVARTGDTGASTGPGEATLPSTGPDPGPGTTAAETDPSTTAGAETVGTATGEPTLPSFGPSGVFGDDIKETDLVGTWTFPWDPVGVPDVSIVIAPDGGFAWRETSADCGAVLAASGNVWVEGTQLIFHVEAWDKRDPWQVEETLGAPLQRPFRMHLGYAPLGGFVGLAGAPTLTQQYAWRGRTYDRQQAGTGGVGTWISEAELWALVAGQSAPRLIVRDRFTAVLAAAGQGTLTTQRSWWFPTGKPNYEPPAEQALTWVDETPGAIAGAANVGGTRHAYDAVHMLTFVPDQSLKLGVISDCL